MITTPHNTASRPDYATARIDWSPEDYAAFGRKTQLFSHGYDRLPLFETSALIALLDDYPRSRLQAFTMGTDLTRWQDWYSVDIHPDTTGEEVWQAVEKGRLWLNIICLEQYSRDFADLVKGM